ncbi:MAG TPA: SLATT domain-containing protein, partial [Verrucomicrobiae bacterium]|nr:SLATT domain-containing protein [Verrucomicrobiae bacterium]
MWIDTDPAKSLQDIRKAAEEEAQKVIDWYWRSKKWKCTLSRYIQFFALFLTALAGIAPIIIQVLKGSGVPFGASFDSGAIASLCIGIAASLIGLDKAF